MADWPTWLATNLDSDLSHKTRRRVGNNWKVLRGIGFGRRETVSVCVRVEWALRAPRR